MNKGWKRRVIVEMIKGSSNEILCEEGKMHEYRLSLNALTSIYVQNTTRIKYYYQWRNMIILIDNYTHNFIDTHMIGEIRASIIKTIILVLITANESVMRYDS
jgi:hypothetical protein